MVFFPSLLVPDHSSLLFLNKLIFAGEITGSFIFKIHYHKEGYYVNNKVRLFFLGILPEGADIFCPVHHHAQLKTDKFWALNEDLLK